MLATTHHVILAILAVAVGAILAVTVLASHAHLILMAYIFFTQTGYI